MSDPPPSPSSEPSSERLVSLFGTRAAAMRNRDASLVEVAAHTDAGLIEPKVVGRILDARYEPDEGVVGVIQFENVAIAGPLAWTGLVGRSECIGVALARLTRDGRGHLVGLSAVFGVDPTAHKSLPLPASAESSAGAISLVDAIDIVFFPSSDARLLEPIDERWTQTCSD